MNIQHIPTPKGEPNYLLFTANFFLGDTFFKMAAAETLAGNGKATGTYSVLLLSADGTHRFETYKDGSKGWKSDFTVLTKEQLRIVGALIEDAQKVERPVFDLQGN